MKNKKIVLLSSILLVVILSSFITINNKKKNISNENKIDYVPNEETAIKIAEAIWLPIYGENIYNKKPFKAELKDNIWIVKGSLPEKMVGGVPYIEIQKSDCKILGVAHGK